MPALALGDHSLYGLPVRVSDKRTGVISKKVWKILDISDHGDDPDWVLLDRGWIDQDRVYERRWNLRTIDGGHLVVNDLSRALYASDALRGPAAARIAARMEEKRPIGLVGGKYSRGAKGLTIQLAAPRTVAIMAALEIVCEGIAGRMREAIDEGRLPSEVPIYRDQYGISARIWTEYRGQVQRLTALDAGEAKLVSWFANRATLLEQVAGEHL